MTRNINTGWKTWTRKGERNLYIDKATMIPTEVHKAEPK